MNELWMNEWRCCGSASVRQTILLNEWMNELMTEWEWMNELMKMNEWRCCGSAPVRQTFLFQWMNEWINDRIRMNEWMMNERMKMLW